MEYQQLQVLKIYKQPLVLKVVLSKWEVSTQQRIQVFFSFLEIKILFHSFIDFKLF